VNRLPGSVVLPSDAELTVMVEVKSEPKVATVRLTTSKMKLVVMVSVTRDCVVIVVNVVLVVVVSTSVLIVRVVAGRVVRVTSAIWKLVKMVWVLVKMRYLASSVVSKKVI